MKKYTILTKQSFIFLFLVFLFAFLSYQLVEAQSSYWRCPMIGNTGPVVIFKADDYCSETDKWQRFYNLIEKYNICASIGIITSCVTDGDAIKELHNKYYTNDVNDLVNRYEFWNHGFTHGDGGLYPIEFRNQDINSQYNSLENAQNVFINNLGFESNAFGSPFNCLDQNTKPAIDEYNSNNSDQIKVWMGIYSSFNSIDHTGWNYLGQFEYGSDYNHLIYGIDYADGNNNCLPCDDNGKRLPSGHFMGYYNSGDFDNRPFILIQIHPDQWKIGTDSSFTELENMIVFLKNKGALFVTPSYLHSKANNEQYCGDFYGANTINATSSLSAGHSPQCTYTTVHNNANVSFTASKNIYLLPGFNSEAGSRLHAYIVPLNSMKSAKAQDVNKLANTELKKNVSDESKVYLYPNPNLNNS